MFDPASRAVRTASASWSAGFGEGEPSSTACITRVAHGLPGSIAVARRLRLLGSNVYRMRYDEVTNLITGSSPDDWALIEIVGDVYLDRLEQASSGDRNWLEVESHGYLAVYRADVDLRLAWGMTKDTGLTFEGWDFPDRSIDRQYVDGFWRGALVARWPVLSVDGGRCYLPSPYLSAVETGARPQDLEIVGTTVKASETALARLLQRVLGRDDRDFDSYLQRTNAVEIADEDPA